MESAVDFVRRHDLDGFDVDWEYPGQPGDGNVNRPEDKLSFTAAMAERRAALDKEGAAKSRYIREHGLAGAMFWEYSSDPTGALLGALFDGLRGCATP